MQLFPPLGPAPQAVIKTLPHCKMSQEFCLHCCAWRSHIAHWGQNRGRWSKVSFSYYSLKGEESEFHPRPFVVEAVFLASTVTRLSNSTHALVLKLNYWGIYHIRFDTKNKTENVIMLRKEKHLFSQQNYTKIIPRHLLLNTPSLA